jgi:hypothetical protein
MRRAARDLYTARGGACHLKQYVSELPKPLREFVEWHQSRIDILQLRRHPIRSGPIARDRPVAQSPFPRGPAPTRFPFDEFQPCPICQLAIPCDDYRFHEPLAGSEPGEG